MDFLRGKLEKFGITGEKATKFIMTYKLVETSTFFGGWFLCHRYRPMKSLAKTQAFKNTIQKIKIDYPKLYNFGLNSKIKVENRLKDSKIFQKFSDTIGTQKKHLAGSLVEIILIKNFCFPILAPIELGTTWIIVKSFEIKEDIEEGVSNLVDEQMNKFVRPNKINEINENNKYNQNIDYFENIKKALLINILT